MGAAVALALAMMAAAAAAAPENATLMPPISSTSFPLYMPNPPKLDRAHRDKLLVEAPCEQYCKHVVWQIKVAGDSIWSPADSEQHANFPDTFYLRGLRADTPYELRALFRRPGLFLPYTGAEVPTLEARTCPDNPPPVSNLHAHSAGPGWLEVRWTPPPKEACKSHLYYQARYAPAGTYFSAWRQYGFYRNDRWVHFRPTHPCAVWPLQFCMLVTDTVKAGEQHVVEVRVSRFDELRPALSESRKVVVRASTACVANDTCGVIGGAPIPTSIVTDVPTVTTTKAPEEVDIDDSDIASTTLSPDDTTLTPLNAVTKATINGSRGSGQEQQEAAEHRSQAASSPSGGNSLFGRLGPVFLTLLLVACAALPIAYLYGKRRGAREAVELHMVPAWRRRLGGDGGSQPVLAEEGTDEGDAGATLQVDHHGRYSWVKLVPSPDD